MKNFIKALDERGITEAIVKSAIMTEKVTGRSITKGGLALILDYHMTEDEELEDIFLMDAHEIALDIVLDCIQKNVDAKKKNNVEVEKSLFEELKNVIDDFFKNLEDDCK